MLNAAPDLTLHKLRVAVQVRHVVDGRARDTPGARAGAPPLGGPGAGPFGQAPVELVVGSPAPVEARQPSLASPLGIAQGRSQRRPLGVVVDADRTPAHKTPNLTPRQ